MWQGIYESEAITKQIHIYQIVNGEDRDNPYSAF